jgi:hypothetical protein
MLAAILARSGARDSALHVIDRIHERQRSEHGPPPGRLEEAWVRLLLGDRDLALTLVARHIAIAPMAAAIVARTPWFVPLHGDPRFEDAVRLAR